MADPRDHKKTVPVTAFIAGNNVFNRAVFAIGLDGTATRHLLAEALRTVGGRPLETTVEELATLLPEIERRVQLLVPPDIARDAIARLRSLILRWEELEQ